MDPKKKETNKVSSLIIPAFCLRHFPDHNAGRGIANKCHENVNHNWRKVTQGKTSRNDMEDAIGR